MPPSEHDHDSSRADQRPPDNPCLRVRPAAGKDVLELRELVRDTAGRGVCFAASPAVALYTRRMLGRLDMALAAAAAKPLEDRVFVATDQDDLPVGVGAIHRDGPRCYLHLFNSSREGQGVGQALIAACLNHAREVWDCRWALAEVFRQNERGMRFWFAAEFNAAAERPSLGLPGASLVLLARALLRNRASRLTTRHRGGSCCLR